MGVACTAGFFDLEGVGVDAAEGVNSFSFPFKEDARGTSEGVLDTLRAGVDLFLGAGAGAITLSLAVVEEEPVGDGLSLFEG